MTPDSLVQLYLDNAAKSLEAALKAKHKSSRDKYFTQYETWKLAAKAAKTLL